jgi:hypothetical protein
MYNKLLHTESDNSGGNERFVFVDWFIVTAIDLAK